MKRVLILLSVILPTIAFARIGETRQQCDARYGAGGPPSTINPNANSTTASYNKSGLSISVWFINGRAGHISYSNIDAKPLTKDQLATLRSANSGAVEIKSTSNYMIEFKSTSYDADVKKAAEKATKLKGF